MNMTFLFLVALFSQTFLENPPADFLSLIDTKSALQDLKIDAGEDRLIALLDAPAAAVTPGQIQQAARDLGDDSFRVRKAAAKRLRSVGEAAVPALRELLKSDDPEVSVTARNMLKEMAAERRQAEEEGRGYAAKLLAVKRLGELKSNKGEAVLTTLSEGKDAGLSQAAKEALQRIRGTEPERISGRKKLRQTLGHLPSNPGFVAMLDLERGAEFLPPLLARMMKENGPMMQNMMGGEGRNEVRQGLLTALNTVGNVRIDSVTMVLSDDLMDRSGHVTFVFNGQYDIDRWDRWMKEELRRVERIERKGQRLFFERRGEASFCLLDSSTFVLTAGPELDRATFLRIVDQVTEKKEPAQVAKDAFALMGEGQRLTAAGSFTKEQRKFFVGLVNDEMGRFKDAKRGEPKWLELRALRLMSGAIQMDNLRGTLSDQGDVTLSGESTDAEQAAALNTTATELNEGLGEELRKMLANVPPDMKNMFGEFKPGGKLWTSEVEGRKMTLKSGELKLTRFLPAMAFGAVPRAAPPARERAQPVPVRPAPPVQRVVPKDAVPVPK